jgi:2',3'-cyclic-nucleotide 2'-phosphodiesterase (5'-nucleotidase family)
MRQMERCAISSLILLSALACISNAVPDLKSGRRLMATAVKTQTSVPIRILHINDNHARFEPVDTSFNTCKNTTVCFGGFARQQAAIDSLRANFSGDVLVVHAVRFHPN